MTTYRDLTEFEFLDFDHELENLGVNHPHVVRREIETIYRDEFALQLIEEDWPVLCEQELEGWARSFYTLEGHMNAILAYATPDIPFADVNFPVYKAAVDSVENELRSLPITRVFDVLTELHLVKYEQSSAAGYDYIGHKGPIEGINHERAIKRAKATFWSAVKDPEQGFVVGVIYWFSCLFARFLIRRKRWLSLPY